MFGALPDTGVIAAVESIPGPIWGALIVAIPAFLSPPIMAWLSGRQKAQERLAEAAARRLEKELEKQEREDARQAVKDDLAAVAVKAAKVADNLLASNERVAASTETTKNKLEEVRIIGEKNHALSNSALTAVMQLALNATERELSSLKRELATNEELIAIKRASGQDPSRDIQDAIAGTKADILTLGKRLVEMRAAVDARIKQQEKQDAKGV